METELLLSRHTEFRGGPHSHSEKAVVIAAVVPCPAGFAVALGNCIAANTTVGPSGITLLDTPSEIGVLLNRKGPQGLGLALHPTKVTMASPALKTKSMRCLHFLLCFCYHCPTAAAL